jgi:hypothetical protein
MTSEEYNILKAKREGYRTALFNNTAMPMEDIDKLVNQTFPIPIRQEPHEIILSNGDGFKIVGLAVMKFPYGGIKWVVSDFTVEDLKRLGDLYKNPTRTVEDIRAEV